MANEEGSRPRRGRLEYEFSMSDLRHRFTTSRNFSIDGIPGFSIEACYTLNERNLLINISKINSEIIYADLSLTVTQNNRCIMERAEECIVWVKTYSFIHESCMLSNSRLGVTCDITLYDSLENINPPAIPANLHNDIKSFLLSSNLSDFKIVIGGQELPIHKFVLGAQSSVFLSIFQADMRGPNSNRVVIEDISINTMKRVLAYLYTRSLEPLKNPKMALEMLLAAKKYNIMQLKDSCESKLTTQITILNALELFEKASVHNFGTLKVSSFRFIVENKNPIINQPEFTTLYFKNPKLMYSVIMRW